MSPLRGGCRAACDVPHILAVLVRNACKDYWAPYAAVRQRSVKARQPISGRALVVVHDQAASGGRGSGAIFPSNYGVRRT